MPSHHAQQLAARTIALLHARSTHGLDHQVKRTLFLPSATQSVPLLERTPEDVQKKNHSVASKKEKGRNRSVSPQFHNHRVVPIRLQYRDSLYVSHFAIAIHLRV